MNVNDILSNIWKNPINESNIGNQSMLNINNSLQGILEKIPEFNNKILTPKIVVVGSQSSGKSSVLNGLMSMDILPTGSSMVTRTPLNIQLIQSDKYLIEFGRYPSSGWETKKTIKLSALPTNDELGLIRTEINRQTEKFAGDNMNISYEEIHIKLYSPNIPNLNIIDLPGLTMVPCTDRGQPKDIKDQIRNLVKKYITSDKTLILGVFPARVDIETDIALELIKEVDYDLKRTIGVLTKIDLMNTDTDIANYLDNSISNDLKLGYGYYAVKNRSNKESKSFDIYQGFKLEEEYFKNNKIYSTCNSSKLGIKNLGIKLSEILIETIKEHLPEMIHKINTLNDSINKKIISLGVSLPETKEGRITFLNVEVDRICSAINESINYRGNNLNYGRKIKDIFNSFRNQSDAINSFDNSKCSDDYINNTIKNCEGNHMSFPLPPIEFLESCILDQNKNPFNSMIELSTKCLENIYIIILDLVNCILSNENLIRFKKIHIKIKDTIIKSIQTEKTNTINKIKDLIEIEKNYIWTDDNEFKKNLQNLFSKNKIDNEILRNILNEYFNSIKKIIKHIIPKTIMYFFVNNFSKNLRHILCEKIQNKDFYELLEESKDSKKKKSNLLEYKTRIETAKELLDSL